MQKVAKYNSKKMAKKVLQMISLESINEIENLEMNKCNYLQLNDKHFYIFNDDPEKSTTYYFLNSFEPKYYKIFVDTMKLLFEKQDLTQIDTINICNHYYKTKKNHISTVIYNKITIHQQLTNPNSFDMNDHNILRLLGLYFYEETFTELKKYRYSYLAENLFIQSINLGNKYAVYDLFKMFYDEKTWTNLDLKNIEHILICCDVHFKQHPYYDLLKNVIDCKMATIYLHYYKYDNCLAILNDFILQYDATINMTENKRNLYGSICEKIGKCYLGKTNIDEAKKWFLNGVLMKNTKCMKHLYIQFANKIDIYILLQPFLEIINSWNNETMDYIIYMFKNNSSVIRYLKLEKYNERKINLKRKFDIFVNNNNISQCIICHDEDKIVAPICNNNHQLCYVCYGTVIEKLKDGQDESELCPFRCTQKKTRI